MFLILTGYLASFYPLLSRGMNIRLLNQMMKANVEHGSTFLALIERAESTLTEFRTEEKSAKHVNDSVVTRMSLHLVMSRVE